MRLASFSADLDILLLPSCNDNAAAAAAAAAAAQID
jgi:hypothetical protein